MFELFLMDLLPEKRKEFLEAHGCWDVDVEDPKTFPNNWDIFPIMVFDPQDNVECQHGGDHTDCGSCAYGSDYAWNEEAQDCLRIKEE